MDSESSAQESQPERVPNDTFAPSGINVVGIGASAGGLRALQRFFAHMPADSGMAFVVILHLSPTAESNAAAILQQATTMPIAQVTSPTQVGRNHVYVIPPDKLLSMQDGTIHLEDPDGERVRRAPIDLFFRTLADSHGRNAAAVVLSGSGADGTVGVQRIKENGGAVLAQEPQEAEFDAMPRNVIATGLVDFILPVADMPAALIEYWRTAETVQLPLNMALPASDDDMLRDIFAVLRMRTGHDFSQYKRPTLLRRIGRRMQVNNVTNLSAYLHVLRSNPEEVQALLRDLLISVTNFFRDPDAWMSLAAIIPNLFANKDVGDQVRVWVAGCATGEEAYTVAMLLYEHAVTLDGPPSIQIFATDIDEEAINTARQGLYPETIVADVSPERLQRFFTPEQNGYRIRKEIRDMVLFAPHNLVRDPPFSRLDLITCRNLLIYLNREVQEQVLQLFHFVLRSEGYLLLGASESTDNLPGLFTPIDKGARLFQRRSAPLSTLVTMPGAPLVRSGHATSGSHARATEGLAQSFAELDLQVLARYGPPRVIINENYDVVHLAQGAGRFLDLPDGELSPNLLRMVHPDLRLELRAALFTAQQRHENTETRWIRTNIDAASRLVHIRVQPIREPEWASGYMLVLFNDMADTGEIIRITATDTEPMVQQLDEELQRTKEQLRATIEQYETAMEEYKAANEELQAINEELRAATEELETGKEELQSVNEELITVNQELKHKVEEVSRANNDLQNLMASTEIATIFVDRELRVRRYTPSAQTIFNLILGDVNRPLAHVTHMLDYPQMGDDAAGVLKTLIRVEREVASQDRHWYMVRLLPYRTIEDKIDGVALTFVDITERKQREWQQVFLLKLSDALRLQSDAVEIQATVTSIGMDYFGVDRCYYCEIEDNKAIIRRDASRGDLPSVAGIYPLDSFPLFKAMMNNGVPLVVQDSNVTDLMDEELRRLCIQMKIISFINVPVIKNDQYVGNLCITQSTPRNWADFEVKLAEETAEPTWAAVERARAEEALRESEAKLTIELADTQQLQRISSSLIEENNVNALYEQILDAARVLMRSDMASIQMLVPERNELFLLAQQRFAPESAKFWEWVQANDTTSCGLAFAGSEPVIVPDVELWDFVVGTENLMHYRLSGIRAMMSTPLISRDGHLVGVISTHWRDVHQPTERELRLFDVLARQTADLIERAHAEAALRESEEKYRTLFTAMNQGFCVMEKIETAAGQPSDFRYLTANPAFERHTGMHNVVGKTIREFVPDAEQRIMDIYDEVVRTRQHHQFEGYVSALDLWMEAEVFPAQMPDQIAVLFSNVSQRRRAEVALRDSEERFRTLADAVPQIIWTNDAEGKANYFNQRWFEYSGLTYEESAGPGWQAIVHHDDAPGSVEQWQEALANAEVFDTEYRLRRADSMYRWFIGRNVPLRDANGTIIGWFGSATDIEDLKQAEAARRESEERFRLLVEGARDYAMFLLDPENRITFWSAGAEHVFGWDEAEALGQSGAIIFTPEDRERGAPEHEIRTAIEDGRALDQRWHVKKDSTRVFVNGVLSRMDDEHGNLRGFVKIGRDATAQRRAEEALQRARDELELRVQERTVELAQANTRLQELVRALVTAQEDERRRIARELHDQLGQQLSALRLNLATLSETSPTESKSAERIERLQEIAEALDRDVDRLAYDLRPSGLDDLGLHAALQQLVNEWMVRHGPLVDLQIIDGPQHPLSSEIETVLYRVVQEALTNIAKHANARHVSVILERRDSQVNVIVEDDGKGFDVEVPQADDGSHHLGLSGMRERTELVGGDLTIESEPGRGTTVYIRIPLPDFKESSYGTQTEDLSGR